MAKKLIAVVTGSNRGIGKAIVEKLASTKNSPQLAIYATSRTGQSLDIKPQHGNEIHYAQLDISDTSSISSFLQQDEIRSNVVDVLINNAGVNLDYNDDDLDLATRASWTIKTNYEGTRNVCLAFLDAKGTSMVSRPGSRIVNVSSAAASLHGYSEQLQQRFRNVSSLPDVDALAKDYIIAITESESEAKRQGWQMPSYSVSKALVNALTIVLATLPGNDKMLINCCDPGWVSTDMGRLVGRPSKSEEEGARTPVKLAIGDLKDVSGRFWGNTDVSSGADGVILPW